MKICMALGSHFSFRKGGAEIQADLLAKHLIKEGNEIHYVCHGEKNSTEPLRYKNNYWIYKVRKPRWNLNMFRYLNKNFLFETLDDIDPDIIYQRGLSFADLITSYGKKNNVPVVSGVSMDNYCKKSLITFSSEGILNLINFKNLVKKNYYTQSDEIIAQTKKQKNLLNHNFGVNSLVIPNGHNVPNRGNIEKSNPPIIYWIANIKEWKQPEIFLKLAQKLKDINAKFIYCGRPSSNKTYQKKLQKKTKKLSNVRYLGEVPFSKTNRLLSKSSLFINTSASLSNEEFKQTEGFPNTYIQAWMRETPVIALNFDPDDILKEKKIGIHSGNFEDLVDDVRYILENEDVRKEMGKRSREHAVENYDIERIGERYLEIFENLLE